MPRARGLLDQPICVDTRSVTNALVLAPLSLLPTIFDVELDGKDFKAWFAQDARTGTLDMIAAQNAFGLEADDPRLVAQPPPAGKLEPGET